MRFESKSGGDVNLQKAASSPPLNLSQSSRCPANSALIKSRLKPEIFVSKALWAPTEASTQRINKAELQLNLME